MSSAFCFQPASNYGTLRAEEACVEPKNASACASRAIGALLSSYFFIGRFGWTSPLFPNEKGKGLSHIEMSIRFPPQMRWDFVTCLAPFIFMNGITGSRRSNNRRRVAPQYTIARSNWGS
jgi:hypothetical protein